MPEEKDRDRPAYPGPVGDQVTVHLAVDGAQPVQIRGQDLAEKTATPAPPTEGAVAQLTLTLLLLPFLTSFMLMLGYAAAQAVLPTLPAPGYWAVFATASVYYLRGFVRWVLLSRTGRSLR